jgi:hypothetical protein
MIELDTTQLPLRRLNSPQGEEITNFPELLRFNILWVLLRIARSLIR